MMLITGGAGGVSRRVIDLLLARGHSVRALVRRDDERADRLRALGADVFVGDLIEGGDVLAALRGVRRMFFTMSVSPDYLRATTEVAAAALEYGELEVLVNMSQMTVSQMTLTGTDESRQHRLHWLAEHVLDWSGLPVVQVRPTVFLDNPLFTVLGAQTVRERGVLSLPFGAGRTSPIAADDVARVVAEVLADPDGRVGDVYELTGPQVLDVAGLAAQFERALGRPVTGEDLPFSRVQRVLTTAGLGAHVQQHISTMAQLHREGRYDRFTDDVERVTGRPAQTVEQYVAAHRDLFGGTA